MKRAAVSTGLFVILIGAWEALVRSGLWSSFLVPSPFEIARFFWTSINDGTLLDASLVTSKRLLLGYGIGLAIGLPLGCLQARIPMVKDTLGVVALGLQTLPSVCWAPLALLWFGQTESAMLFIVLMGTIWSISLATDTGIRNVPPLYIRAAKTLGSRRWHMWLKVILPASLPFVITGMKQGWAFAWRSLMAAEIYISVISGFGLGHLLHFGRELHAMDAVVGIMLVIVFIGIAMDKVIFSPMETYLHKRWGTGRG
jgi:NitT/TauT family transport system permease protein